MINLLIVAGICMPILLLARPLLEKDHHPKVDEGERDPLLGKTQL